MGALRILGFALLLTGPAPSDSSGAAPSGVATGTETRQAGDPYEDSYTVWLCPMHRDHQAHEEGACPLCGMALVQRALTTRYVCLDEPEGADGPVQTGPGVCPATGEPLVPTTREIVWVCLGEDADSGRFEPGECADGSARVLSTRAAEHGDHNPRHGGILFMAPDGVHHLEGTLEDGRFRLYFYDSFTRPLRPEPFEARLASIGEAESGTLPLGGAGDALEAEVNANPEERNEFTAFVTFPDRDREDRFDFIFLSGRELAELAAAGVGDPSSGFSPADVAVPENPAELLAEIRERDRRVRALIAAGRWADLFIPALEAKTLALAYGEAAGPDRRPWVALKKIVRGAWLLDMYGDLGDRERVETSYEIFAEGMRELPGGER